MTTYLLRRGGINIIIMDQQVQTAINEALTNFTSKYELEELVVNDLRELLSASFKTHLKARAVSTTKSGKQARRKTGYNLFIRAKFKEARANKGDGEDKTNSQQLMSEYSREWKDLPDDEKNPYTAEAECLNAESGADTNNKKKGTKKNISGYNLFYKEEKDSVRKEKSDDVTLMKAVGSSWRALEADEKAVYNTRAAEICANRETEAE